MAQCIARERAPRRALGLLLLAEDGYAKDVLRPEQGVLVAV